LPVLATSPHLLLLYSLYLLRLCLPLGQVLSLLRPNPKVHLLSHNVLRPIQLLPAFLATLLPLPLLHLKLQTLINTNFYLLDPLSRTHMHGYLLVLLHKPHHLNPHLDHPHPLRPHLPPPRANHTLSLRDVNCRPRTRRVLCAENSCARRWIPIVRHGWIGSMAECSSRLCIIFSHACRNIIIGRRRSWLR
jgi:hypothetical protein